VTGELDKAAQTYQAEIDNYPRSSAGYGNLGLIYAQEGQYEKAVELTKKAMQLSPEAPTWYSNLAGYTLALRRFAETKQIIQEAQARHFDGSWQHSALYDVAFHAGDTPAMSEQLKWFAGSSDYESDGFSIAADTEAYNGHMGRARELTRKAVDSAVRTDDKESAAIYLASAALQQAAYGDGQEARQTAEAASKLAPESPGAEAIAALAFAMADDPLRAESLSHDLTTRFPHSTQLQALWVPAIEAQVSLDWKDPAGALKTLQAASTIELGQVIYGNNNSCLYHVYVRGEAYMANDKAEAAAAEFQKILDHRGVVGNCWTGALARLGVARAKDLQSRSSRGSDAASARTAALAAYKDFLTLWKDADPDVPILKKAKAEYAKLQ